MTNPNAMLIEECARAAHTVNRAYCTQLGDLSQLGMKHILVDREPVAVEGGWAVRRTIPWAAVATIPMPVRQPDLVVLIGSRGSEVRA